MWDSKLRGSNLPIRAAAITVAFSAFVTCVAFEVKSSLLRIKAWHAYFFDSVFTEQLTVRNKVFDSPETLPDSSRAAVDIVQMLAGKHQKLPSKANYYEIAYLLIFQWIAALFHINYTLFLLRWVFKILL